MTETQLRSKKLNLHNFFSDSPRLKPAPEKSCTQSSTVWSLIRTIVRLTVDWAFNGTQPLHGKPRFSLYCISQFSRQNDSLCETCVYEWLQGIKSVNTSPSMTTLCFKVFSMTTLPPTTSVQGQTCGQSHKFPLMSEAQVQQLLINTH